MMQLATIIFTKFAALGDACDLTKSGPLGFPTWYSYLHGTTDPNGRCAPVLNGINDIWAVVAAIAEILLRVAALAAVAMIIYAGFSYTTSQGEAEATAKAKNTLINALIGLAIAVMAASIISFLGKRIAG